MADTKTIEVLEAENSTLLTKVEELENSNAELELKLAALEGAALEKTPAKISIPSKPIKANGKKYQWTVANIRLHGEVLPTASLSAEDIENLLAIEGQGLLLEVK
jgi:hypothetical protein